MEIPNCSGYVRAADPPGTQMQRCAGCGKEHPYYRFRDDGLCWEHECENQYSQYQESKAKTDSGEPVVVKTNHHIRPSEYAPSPFGKCEHVVKGMLPNSSMVKSVLGVTAENDYGPYYVYVCLECLKVDFENM